MKNLYFIVSAMTALCLLINTYGFYAIAYNIQTMIVIVPVENVVSTPGQDYNGIVAPITNKNKVPLLKTQVLFNEVVLAQKEQGEWVQIKLLEQAELISPHPTYVEGWIHKFSVIPLAQKPEYNVVTTEHWTKLYTSKREDSTVLMSVSIGTKFFAQKIDTSWWQTTLHDNNKAFLRHKDIYHFEEYIENEQTLRTMIVSLAKKMLGLPFCWYGRSSYDKNNRLQLTSIGCDGAIDLLYRCCGLLIPRFAQYQYQQGCSVNGDFLKPGDLVFFLTDENSASDETCSHAMIYLGNNELLEATNNSEPPTFPTRTIICTKRMHKSISSIKNQELFKGWQSLRIYLCSYLIDKEKLKKSRQAARSSWLHIS